MRGKNELQKLKFVHFFNYLLLYFAYHVIHVNKCYLELFKSLRTKFKGYYDITNEQFLYKK